MRAVLPSLLRQKSRRGLREAAEKIELDDLEDLADLSKAQQEGDEADVPREYKEGKCTQCCLRCCGNTCWVVFGLCVVAWVANGIAIQGGSSLSGAPAFSKTLLWRSLAHHTDRWDEWQQSIPPPPPEFE